MNNTTIRTKSATGIRKNRVGLLLGCCCMMACAPAREADLLKADIARLIVERDSLLQSVTPAPRSDRLLLRRLTRDTQARKGHRPRAEGFELPLKDPPWDME